MKDKDRQLVMSRYAMHKVRLRDYVGAVLSGRLTREQAAEEYRKAMENYDQILDLAVKESERLTACQAEMLRGFYLPGED